MPRVTTLDRQWQQLMALCERESKLRAEGTHPRLAKLIAADIERIGIEMGFSAERVASRDFRAEREAGHIVRLLTG
jgi:hypothetical protein